MRGTYLSSGVTNNAIFSLNVDDASFNKMIHDSALRVDRGDKLTIVAHYPSSDIIV